MIINNKTADGYRIIVAVHAVTGAVAEVRLVAHVAVRRPRAGLGLCLKAVRQAGARLTRTALGYVTVTRRFAANAGRRQAAIHAVTGGG
jgi:hypothetical protein